MWDGESREWSDGLDTDLTPAIELDLAVDERAQHQKKKNDANATREHRDEGVVFRDFILLIEFDVGLLFGDVCARSPMISTV